MSDERFECISGDGTVLDVGGMETGYNGKPGVRIGMLATYDDVRSITLYADPATADSIASAIHVAAAQVRSARGEKADAKHVADSSGACAFVTIRDESDAPAVFSRADVPRLIAELGAWLAAHEA